MKPPSLLLIASAASLVLAFAAGCGVGGEGAGEGGTGGSTSSTADVRGMYEVTHLTRNDRSCAAEGAVVTGVFAYSHFRIDDTYGFAECDSADPSSCNASFRGSPWNRIAYEPAGDGNYQGDAPEGVWIDAPPDCFLNYYDGLLSIDDSGDVRIDVHIYSEAGEPCTNDEAESRGKDMPCVEWDVVAGTKVP